MIAGSTPARLGAFVLGALASFAASVFVSGAILGTMGVSSPVAGTALASAFFAAALLALSRWLLRAEQLTLTALGLEQSEIRLRQFGVGFAITACLFLSVAGVQSGMVGARWQFQGIAGLRAALVGLALTGLLSLVEEVLFRGVALRYLRTLYGDRPALLLSALLFGAYHLVQSGDWAMGAVFRFTLPVLGGLLFGWAAIRSKGLALPLGLHVGGNWVQAAIAGFAPIGTADPVRALFRIPVSDADVRLLAAPDLVQHLPYLIALVMAFAMVRLLSSARRESAVT